MVVAEAPAEPDADAVAGADLAKAGVHGADELVGLVDAAAELFGDATEDEAGEDGTLALAQGGPAASTRAARMRATPARVCSSPAPRDPDEEHAVIDGVLNVELAGYLTIKVAERIGGHCQRSRLARRRDRGQHGRAADRTSPIAPAGRSRAARRRSHAAAARPGMTRPRLNRCAAATISARSAGERPRRLSR